MSEFVTEACRSCNAQIIRAIHVRTLRPSVIDAEPVPNGDIALVQVNGKAVYRVIPVPGRFGRKDLRTSHFATCKDAGQWRHR